MSRRTRRKQYQQAIQTAAALARTTSFMSGRITSLEGAMAMDRGLLAKQSEQLREARDYARDVASQVNRCAIAAGVPTRLEGQAFDRMRLPADAPERAGRVGFMATDVVELRIETLRTLEVDAVRNALSRELHVYVTLADGRAAYAISESALQRMPAAELEGRIARELAALLVRGIKSTTQRRPYERRNAFGFE